MEQKIAVKLFEVKQVRSAWNETDFRDNMTNLELVLNMLAEATMTEISKERHPQNFEENRVIAKQGDTIAGNTRREIEEKRAKMLSAVCKTSAAGKKQLS